MHSFVSGTWSAEERPSSCSFLKCFPLPFLTALFFVPWLLLLPACESHLQGEGRAVSVAAVVMHCSGLSQLPGARACIRTTQSRFNEMDDGRRVGSLQFYLHSVRWLKYYITLLERKNGILLELLIPFNSFWYISSQFTLLFWSGYNASFEKTLLKIKGHSNLDIST